MLGVVEAWRTPQLEGGGVGEGEDDGPCRGRPPLFHVDDATIDHSEGKYSVQEDEERKYLLLKKTKNKKNS